MAAARASRRLGLHPLPLVLALTLGVLAGTGLFTVVHAKGVSYLSDDPEACANCHVMRTYLDSWGRSAHNAAATCNGCHVPHAFVRKHWAKALNGYHHSRAFTLQEYPDNLGITDRNAEVLQENCIDCHRSVTSLIRGEPGTGEDPTCTRCHRSVGHGPVG